MLHSDSCQIMDKIFASNSSEAKVVLLRTICDFLVSQSSDDSQQEESGWPYYLCLYLSALICHFLQLQRPTLT